MDIFDITIIGAGVVGLAVASEVSSPSRRVMILEKNDSFGEESSSRNSEVIHAGLYYPRGSLKARACLEGRRMLYDVCPAHNIGCRKIGKIIVAVDDRELAALDNIAATAADNGVDLQRLTAREVKDMEPRAACRAALFSPETGIIDSHQLMEYCLEKAKDRGADLVCRAVVKGLAKGSAGWKITVDNQGEELAITSRTVVNCAGLQADRVARMAGIDLASAGYDQYFLKGSYFRLSDRFRGATRRLIYPVPDEHSLGIHTVLDLNGGIRLGPDEEAVSDIAYPVDPAKRRRFFESAHRFLPEISEEDLSPDMAGIRPQLRRADASGFRDFIIREDSDKGCPGLVNCIGIESPGLTAALYIGRYAAGLLRDRC